MTVESVLEKLKDLKDNFESRSNMRLGYGDDPSFEEGKCQAYDSAADDIEDLINEIKDDCK